MRCKQFKKSKMDSKPTYKELEIQIEKLKQYNENGQRNSSIQNGDVYHSLIDNMSEGFAHCQMIYENNTPVDFIYLEVNQAFERLTGLKNVVGKRISEVIVNHRADNPKLFDLYSRVSQTGISEKIESFIEPLEQWFSISVYSSQKKQFLVVFNNITTRKQSEEVLRISEAQFRGLFTQSHVGIAIVGLDKCIIKCNKAFCYFWGYSEKEMLGKTVAHFTYPEDLEIGKNEMNRIVNGEIEFAKVQKRYLRKDGVVVWGELTISMVRSHDNKPLYFLPVIQDITKRYEIDKALKESEEKFRGLYTAIKQGMGLCEVIIDKNGKPIDYKFLDINDTYTKLTGLTRKMTIGKTALQINPEIEKYWIKNMGDVAVTGKPAYYENYNEASNKWYSVYAYCPKKNQFAVFVNDITEKKETEEKLKESEIKYKDLVEKADIAILIDDENGFLKFFNDKFCKIFGYTRKEIGQLPIRGIVHRDDVEIVMNHHNNRIRGEEVKAKYEFRGVCKNGKTVHLMVSVVPVKSNGKIIGSQSYIWDITERKHMEVVLLENKHRNEKSQALGHVGNWEYNIETKLFWVSDESKRIYGFNLNSNNFSIEQTESCIPERKRVHQALIDLIYHDKKYDLEFEIIPADKTPRRIIHSIAELERDASNNLLRVRGVILDITERKYAEQIIKENEIRLRDLNVTKDKLFSIISHDLRSPFNGILGFSELLIENIRHYEITESEKYLRIINSSAQHTLILLDNLLNWARLQTGQITFNPKKVSLSSIISETIELSKTVAIGKNISISQNKPDDIEVCADKDMLEIVLRNLISNAIKFTKSDGNISVLAKKEQSQVEIAISDNGVGMNEETMSKLFRIETNKTTIGTADEKGSGLGLILCKELVEKQGGKIWVESVLGKGSVFKFSLPMNKSSE
jgi:PAS domain S-box-containing protein